MHGPFITRDDSFQCEQRKWQGRCSGHDLIHVSFPAEAQVPMSRSVFFVISLLFITTSISAQDRPDRTRFLRWYYQDIGTLVKKTNPKTALYVGGSAVAVVGFSHLDADVNPWLRDRYTGGFKDVLEVADFAGGPNVNFVVLSLAGTSLLTRNEKFQDAAMTSLQTLVYAGLLGYGLKGILGRLRPEQTENPHLWFETTGKNPFSDEGNSSFPSGHAISSFGIITPWVVYYPSAFTYSLFVIPVGTMLSRLAIYKHWATDMAAGATIGILMGRWLALLHQHERVNAAKVDIAMGLGNLTITWNL